MVLKVPVRELIEENTYFYIDDETKHGFLIDPGAEEEKLLEIIQEHQFVIEKILLTHGHFDHIGAVNGLREKLKIDVFAYDDKYLLDPRYNLSRFYGGDLIVEHSKKLKELETLSNTNKCSLKVIYTPGHTEDSCIFYNEEEKIAFTGDTIFKDSFGNPDFPGGNYEMLIKSIQEKILTLPEETILYSGHSEETTVKDEKRNY